MCLLIDCYCARYGAVGLMCRLILIGDGAKKCVDREVEPK